MLSVCVVGSSSLLPPVSWHWSGARGTGSRTRRRGLQRAYRGTSSQPPLLRAVARPARVPPLVRRRRGAAPEEILQRSSGPGVCVTTRSASIPPPTVGGRAVVHLPAGGVGRPPAGGVDPGRDAAGHQHPAGGSPRVGVAACHPSGDDLLRRRLRRSLHRWRCRSCSGWGVPATFFVMTVVAVTSPGWAQPRPGPQA